MMGQPMGQPLNQPMGQPLNQPMNHPGQPMNHPGQPYSPHPPQAHAHTMPPAVKKSKTGLYVGLALGAVAVTGGIIAIVMLTGGKSAPSGGGSSREDVVRKTFAALSSGDGDALMTLSGAEGKERYIKCDGQPPPEKRKKLMEEVRDRFKESVKPTKGVKIEILEIGKDDEPDVTKKGKKFDSGESECKTTVDMTEHRFEVRYKATQGDRKGTEQEAEMSVIAVAGGWFLDRVPEIKVAGSCDAAVGHAMDKTQIEMLNKAPANPGALKSALAEIRAIGIKHCKDDSWDDDVLDCLAIADTAIAMDSCNKKLSTTQREKFEAEANEAFKKYREKTAPPPPPPDTTSATGPNCAAYKQLIMTIQCAEITEDSRKALLDTFDELVKMAAGSSGDPEQGCLVAISTLKQMCNQ